MRSYEVQVRSNGEWIPFSKGQSIGNKRIDFFQATSPQMPKPVLVDALRFKALEATDEPMLKEISLYAPCPNPTHFKSPLASIQ